MANSAAPLINIFGTTDYLVPLILEDLSDADVRTRAREGDGPSIAWHLGHLLSYRCNGLTLLGQAGDNPYEAAFGSSPATDGRDYPTPTDLGEQWISVSKQFMAALASATDEDLQAPAAGGAHAEECVRDKLAFMAFHEGYHIGSVATLQKTLGKSSPPEKIMAAMKGAN
jgi:uncharacterized damage-inducible protein DinB